MTAADTVDFDLDIEDDDADLPPLCAFRLGGKVWHIKNEDFISLALFNKATSSDGMQVAEYFEAVLIPDEWPTFRKMLINPPAGMTIGKIRSAMRKTADKVLGFPTTADSGSSTNTSTARVRKPKRSAAASSSTGTRRRASGE